ncbi:MAG: cytochrome b/b6 domain-containing protein [Rubrivivax sp.]|nr:cytochrome b/b6 domain-containing protein [Rubrivivax sp.]
MPEAPGAAPVRVWDLPTRLFHWLLAASLVGSVITANIGGNAIVWHARLGYLALALVVFRIVWGFVGGRWSRFASFAYAPGTLWRYLRGGSRPHEHHDVGHSPLGALSVFALLALVAVQVATGLVADDEIAFTGPLNRFVDSATGLAATGWHRGWGKTLLLVFVGLHVAAIVYYRLARGRDLIGPMLGGDKRLPPGTPGSADGAAQRLLALVVAAASGGLATWVAALGF